MFQFLFLNLCTFGYMKGNNPIWKWLSACDKILNKNIEYWQEKTYITGLAKIKINIRHKTIVEVNVMVGRIVFWIWPLRPLTVRQHKYRCGQQSSTQFDVGSGLKDSAPRSLHWSTSSWSGWQLARVSAPPELHDWKPITKIRIWTVRGTRLAFTKPRIKLELSSSCGTARLDCTFLS